MPFHVLAFRTASLGSDASNVALGLPTDQMFAQSNGGYVMPRNMTLLASYFGNDAFTDVRLNAPSLRRLWLPSLDPTSATVLPGNVPPINWFGETGPDLAYTEAVSVEASRGTVAASEAAGLLWVADSRILPAAGPISTVRCTAAVTLSAGTWQSGALTFSQTLPAGKYAVVGMSAYGANLLSVRLVFVDGGLRPGVLAQGAMGEWSNDPFRRGNVGQFGTFNSTAVPSIEAFGIGAGSAQTVFLDLAKIG